MAQSRARAAVRTVLRMACEVLRLLIAQLADENLFLRKLALYVERQVKPRRADDGTRIVLVALSRLIGWRHILTVVKPDTLIRWHRKGFRLFWRWRSLPLGRPRLPTDLQLLIAEMAAANRTWGEERIASELLVKLEIRVAPRTVRRYMSRAVADVEHVCPQSRHRRIAVRFLRDRDRNVPRAVRLCSLGGGHSTDPALECD